MCIRDRYEEGALHLDQVALANIDDKHAAEPRQAEELLDHDGPDEQTRYLQAEHRDDREPYAGQAVPHKRCLLYTSRCV